MKKLVKTRPFENPITRSLVGFLKGPLAGFKLMGIMEFKFLTWLKALRFF
jgi:hypothetical protein